MPNNEDLARLKNLAGVSYHRKSGKFRAFVLFDGKKHFGGLWDTVDEAIADRDKLRIKLRGK